MYKMKITTIDYAILGLLKTESLSGYKIRKTFELTALGDFSSSPGTVYPALKRLKRNLLIEETILEGISKKLLSITQKGLEVLKEWLRQSITITDIKKRDKELLLRFAFMENLIPNDEVVTFLQSYQNFTRTYIKELEDYLEDEDSSISSFGKIAVKHGLISFKANLKWSQQAIKIIKSMN